MMKTKVLFLTGFFAVFCGLQLFAQNARDVYDWPVPSGVVQFEVYCDGELVDVVENTQDYFLKCRDKYKDGNWVNWNQHLNNVSFISLMTGETFKLQGHETGIWETADLGYGGLSGNLIGNLGSHYLLFITYTLNSNYQFLEFETWATCH